MRIVLFSPLENGLAARNLSSIYAVLGSEVSDLVKFILFSNLLHQMPLPKSIPFVIIYLNKSYQNISCN